MHCCLKFNSANAQFSVLTIREEELVRRVEEDNILQWREEVNDFEKPHPSKKMNVKTTFCQIVLPHGF